MPAKKRKKKSAHSLPMVGQDIEEILDTTLQQSRGRKAVALVKDARKAETDLPDEKVLQAYLLRLDEMIQRNQIDNAVQMYEAVLEGWAYWEKHEDTQRRTELLMELQLHDRLDETLGSDQAEQILHDYAFKKITDPAQILTHALFEQQPAIREEAERIVEAWDAIDQRDFAKAQKSLKSVGRRSPLRAWRVFLQALIAYYQENDALMHKCLQRMPENSAVAHLAQCLMALPNAPSGRKIGSTKVKVLDGFLDHSLLRAFADLDRCVKNYGFEADEKGIRLVNKLQSKQPYLAMEVASCLWIDVDELPELHDDAFCPAIWIGFYLRTLRDLPEEHWVKGIELGLRSLRKISYIEDAIPNAIDRAVLFLEYAKKIYVVAEREGVETLDEFRDEDDDVWEMGEHVLPEMLDWQAVGNIGEQICRRSLKECILNETYQLACKFLGRTSEHKLMQKWLNDWQKQFPESLEPLEAALKHGPTCGCWSAYKKANKELEKRGASKRRLRKLRSEGVLKGVASQVDGETNLLKTVLPNLEDLEVEHEWQNLVVDLLKWLSAGKSRREKAAYGKVLQQYESPWIVWFLAAEILPRFTKSRLPAGVKKQLDDAQTLIHDFKAIKPYQDAGWLPKTDELIKLVDDKFSPKIFEPKLEEDNAIEFVRDLMETAITGDWFQYYPDDLQMVLTEMTMPFLKDEHTMVPEIWAARAYAWYYVVKCVYPRELFKGLNPIPGTDDCLAVAFYLQLDDKCDVMSFFEKSHDHLEQVKKRGQEMKKREYNKIVKTEQSYKEYDRMFIRAEKSYAESFGGSSSSFERLFDPLPSKPEVTEQDILNILRQVVNDATMDIQEANGILAFLQKLKFSTHFPSLFENLFEALEAEKDPKSSQQTIAGKNLLHLIRSVFKQTIRGESEPFGSSRPAHEQPELPF